MESSFQRRETGVEEDRGRAGAVHGRVQSTVLVR